MTFQQITAPTGLRTAKPLSADNDRPDRYTLIDRIRQASPALQLKAPVIATLEALLSCLPPQRSHNFVFASNATLAFRRNGISERTLRRHFAQLADIGFLARADSPNGKRFTKHDSHSGHVLRFGFDLGPLFLAFDRICTLAKACTDQASHLSYLRTKLRCAIATTITREPGHPDAALAQRALRRKLTACDLRHWLDRLACVADPQQPDTCTGNAETTQVTAADGQIGRHHPISEKEPSDSDAEENRLLPPAGHPHLTLPDLLTACPEAASYLQSPPTTSRDIVDHARTLAPMMGIDRDAYQRAEDRLGMIGAAVSVWGLLQMHGKIRQMGAYFRAITSGDKSATFDPWALIRRLARQRNWAGC